ncbi:MAG: flagellar hook-associated protein FlgK [Mobilitalea sp.]
MGSTFFGLNIGQTGLYAYQSALDTTAHNITNAETDGYSRQVMGQKAGKALEVNSTYGMAGTGVTVTGVDQMRDDYYDEKYWGNSTMYGEYSSKSYYMNEIENYFNEVSVDGFTTSFNSMGDSLSELQKNPSSLTVRTQVLNYAKSFAEYFNSVSTNLESIQEECNFEIKNQVDQINSTAQQIGALTKQINTLEVTGGTANDLRDQRALLVDELSQIATISVSEKTIGEGVGVTSYTVKLDGTTLVDGGNSNELIVVPREDKANQSDAEGLYDIEWKGGQKFDMRSASLGGSMQALLEVRDGNNQFNLQGTVSADAGDDFVTLTDTNINTIEQLNIPETGSIVVNNREYSYSGFEVTKDSDGKFIYTFELTEPVEVDVADAASQVGESIDYKGIPYYMSQLNEFVRTYAKAFNDIHRTGEDLEGNAGMDVFNATDKVTGRNYTFSPLEGSEDAAFYDYDSFNSQTGGYYEDVPEDQAFYGSYYFMTAKNFTITDELIQDPNLLATASDEVDGIESNDIVDKLIALNDDKLLFKQGSPAGFYDTMIAEIGIDTMKSTNFSDNQENILDAITNQRLSISGVDVDEEAMNLIRYQNAYNLSAKVITVMDEIYDKLINYMGV